MSKKTKATTQDHLDIVDIRNDIVILANGGAVVILENTAINFDLLSIQEQDAAIAAYSGLLNSLSFPIQVTIMSKRMDVSDYLDSVKILEEKQTNKKIKEQLKAYRTFIHDELVTKEDVLDKNFYVTIPYKIFDMTAASMSPFGWIEDMLGLSTRTKSNINVDKVLQEAANDLEPKKNFIVKEFSRMGIVARQLNTTELIKLFYDIYNSETASVQKIRDDISDYTSALVEPKIV